MLRFVIPVLFLFHSASQASIYGADDRRPVDGFQLEELHRSGIYPAAKISTFSVPRFTSLEKRWRLCPDSKWQKLSAIAECSGFLVAPDILVTAGHCVKGFRDCKESPHAWRFDYFFKKNTAQASQTKSQTESRGYKCSDVLFYADIEKGILDLAVIRLDRPFSGFSQAPKWGNIHSTQSLTVLGHPLGLPLIETPNGSVTDEKNEAVVLTNLDTFKVNSGSVVVNTKREIVGMLFAGAQDLKTRMPPQFGKPQCKETFSQDEDFKPAEEVLKGVVLQQVLKSIDPSEIRTSKLSSHKTQ